MFWLIVALLPGIIVQARYFGLGNIVQIAIGIISALIFEGVFLSLRKRSLTPLKDGSAIVTAILLGISIPSLAPWWIMVIGMFFAIVVAKQLYGGLGHNIFNPAMVAYVVLLISFPVQMTQWINPVISMQIGTEQMDLIATFNTIIKSSQDTIFQQFDGITQATPLDKIKSSLNAGSSITEALSSQSVVITEFAGIGWQQINIAFLFGGIFLLALRIIRWQIPLVFLLTLTSCALIKQLVSPESALPVMMQLFSGATMLGAFFILTDPVSASTTPKGQIVYAVLIGILVWVIRSFGNYPDAVAFSVLFANLCVPLIDHYTKPRAYGH